MTTSKMPKTSESVVARKIVVHAAVAPFAHMDSKFFLVFEDNFRPAEPLTAHYNIRTYKTRERAQHMADRFNAKAGVV